MFANTSSKEKEKKQEKQILFKLKEAQGINPKDCQQALFQQSFGFIKQDDKQNKQLAISELQETNFQGLLGQLIMDFDNDKYVGTGTLLLQNNEEGKNHQRAFILTSAHNLYQMQIQEESFKTVEALRFFYQRAGEAFYCLLDGRYFHILSDYLNFPKCTFGLDLALIEVLNYQGIYLDTTNEGITYRWDRSFEDINPQKGEKICLSGYPYNKKGFLLQTEGTIKGANLLPSGYAIIHYDDIEPVGGQSGAAVFLFRKPCWYLIGVHAGFDSFENAFVATGLTLKVFNWIRDRSKTYKITDLPNDEKILSNIIDVNIMKLTDCNQLQFNSIKEKIYCITIQFRSDLEGIEILKIINQLKNIVSVNINLKNTKIKNIDAYGKLLSYMGQMKSLTLNLWGTNVQNIDIFCTDITKLYNLENLSIILWSTQISRIDVLNKEISKLSALQCLNLDLRHTQLNQIDMLGKEIAKMSNADNLKCLYINLWYAITIQNLKGYLDSEYKQFWKRVEQIKQKNVIIQFLIQVI